MLTASQRAPCSSLLQSTQMAMKRICLRPFHNLGLPGDRLPQLKNLLDQRCASQPPLRFIEAHSGLTGLIAENAVGPGGLQFHGMWSSSLTSSFVRGMPDIEAVDTTARLSLVAETLNVTTKPMIYDGDTGGLPEIFGFTVRSLEQLGVSAVVIEDKEGLKQNSLLENSNSLHQLCDIDDFCHRISAGIEARRNPDFMIFARMESLIAGRPMEEALQRAIACVNAGASGIMIHSRKKSPAEVIEFISRFRAVPGCDSVPIVVVPTSYNQITEAELGQVGADICIYANQLLRASYPAMLGVAESILNHSRSYEADKHLMPVKEVTTFNGHKNNNSKIEKFPVEVEKNRLDGASTAARAKATAPPKRAFSMMNNNNEYEFQLLRASYGTAAQEEITEENDEDEDKVCPSRLLNFIKSDLGVRFFTGVPDSCIKTFCAEIDRSNDKDASTNHTIAANEGAAIGLAIGNYLATGDVPMVYMQNSGLGNAANPLVSAAHPEVYGIPMVLMIGWRGSPGEHDEPQHIVSGRKTEEILQALDIETFVLPKSDTGAEETLRNAHDIAIKMNRPVAVLARPDTFSGHVTRPPARGPSSWTREEALLQVIETIGPNDAVVATTGFTSRELYELRESTSQSHSSDFLCVGSMGHAIAIAQGIAMAQPNRKVWCIDGDGAALMHMGSFATSSGLSNLRHLLINNEAHESVGGQKTAASQGPNTRDTFVDVASSVGYQCMGSASTSEDLTTKLSRFSTGSKKGPMFLEVKVSVGARSDLGRPKNSTLCTKNAFMEFCAKEPPATLLDESSSTGFLPNGDPLLLTPGPLTISEGVKSSMLHDYGSRDSKFVALVARVRQRLVSLLQGDNEELSAILLQGSGTFAVEAMITQFVPPKNGKLLILSNGAYGKRMATVCEASNRAYELYESAETEPLNIDEVTKVLDSHPDATHVAVVACETTTGVLNPIPDIANVVKSRGARLLIDAMSSFGVVDLDANMPFDAIAASSNKALQGSPGLGFVIARTPALVESAGNANTITLDLYSQWHAFETSGEFRFTPPTHCLLALNEALDELEAEGGTQARRERYEANCRALVDGMRQLGFETIIPDDSQAPVIVTFRMPTTDTKFDFREFYHSLSSKGYVIYPGKITSEPSFRIGCIGNIFPADMGGFLEAVQTTLQEMDVSLT